MSEKFDNFCSELRTKINDADKRIKDLKANAVGASEKTKVEAKAQHAALENKAKEQKARTAAAEVKAKAWVEEKKTMTHDRIAQWKEQRDVKRMESRADLSEHYAVTAMEIAVAAVDEAERAAVEAVVARIDADGDQGASCEQRRLRPVAGQSPEYRSSKENDMKRSIRIAATVSAVLIGAIGASQGQQVVGSTQLGVAVAELRDVTVGWSAKHQILGPIHLQR